MDATKIQPRMYAIGSDGEYIGTVAGIKDCSIQLVDTVSERRRCSIDIEYAHSVTEDKVWLRLNYNDLISLGKLRGGNSRRNFETGGGFANN
jgi:hypothetical protein